MRTMLRSPEFLILDEATANIDTITEALLQEIINKLPDTTTKVIIAHRLSTIKEADQIFFINNGVIQSATDFEEALNLIEGVKRGS
jgi:ATP-binding cassette subfamily B protein